MALNRRQLLKQAGVIGCSLAAHPLTTTMSFASAPWDNRLVVIILRGAMDGLDALQPVADPAYGVLRPKLSQAAPGAPLAEGFALHPALEPLRPLWQGGEVSFVPAVSTPYRDKRSHFDGQDILEAGTAGEVAIGAARDGWLNRLLASVPGAEGQTAFAVGRDTPLILSGNFPTRSWSPETQLNLTPQARLLLEHIYEGDAPFHAAATEALGLAEGLGQAAEVNSFGEMMRLNRQMQDEARTGNSARVLAEFAAARLLEETRIAAFSLAGWDTHRNQKNGVSRALRELADALLVLKRDLGGVWGKTTVLAMTEFGRTAAENGSNGTDHGTGGLMILSGGALKGGRILGGWPGLDEAALYQRRDLMPLDDVRRYAAWSMREAFSISRDILEQRVFPGLQMGAPLGLLL